MSDLSLAVKRYSFDEKVFEDINDIQYVKDLWPVVYILSDENSKIAYVGETTDAYSRMKSHLKNDKKKTLTVVHMLTSGAFNKSATLDIESNLIKYISGDGKYKLLNGNVGIANHTYYQQEDLYKGIFKVVWNLLRAEGIGVHSLEFIDNSDLYKYSPYKTLTFDQREGLMLIIDCLLSNKFKNIIIEGGAGTGKTILAVFLFKLLHSDNAEFNYKEFGEEEALFTEKIKSLRKKFPNPKMGLVVPMSSFRSTLKKVFQNVNGLKASMVIGPAETTKEKYDILLVDESHRLRRRVNLGAYFGAFDKACIKLGLNKNEADELDFVVHQSNKAILFYDQDQSIKPSDVSLSKFESLKSKPTTRIEYLKSQFRVKGGNGYVAYIDGVLRQTIKPNKIKFKSKDYEFYLFDSLALMVEEIKKKNNEVGLARLVAGYSWPWISKKEPSKFDINIEDVSLRWNNVAVDWINSDNSLEEVGCIHTTQGYDLNYTGVIFGYEISYDKTKDEIFIREENYFDKNGKQSIKDPKELKAYILNIYKTIMLRGIKGTYVYVCDAELRDYLSEFIETFSGEVKSSLIDPNPIMPYTNAVPVYDLKVAAGNFSELQIVDHSDFDWVRVPRGSKASEELFACKVFGESMNKVIPNGALCLFRKYSGGSRNGQIVLVENTNMYDSDFGSCYTIKEYESKKHEDENGWKHQSIILKPLSTDSSYEIIVLEEEDLSTFKVIGTFECVLE